MREWELTSLDTVAFSFDFCHQERHFVSVEAIGDIATDVDGRYTSHDCSSLLVVRVELQEKVVKGEEEG